MDIKKIKAIVNTSIAKGRTEEALSFLINEIEEGDIKDEVVFLMGNFNSNKDQFETRGTIDKKEYDIAFSKNIQAIQNVLKKLELREGDNIDKPNNKFISPIFLSLVTIGVICIILFQVFPNNSISGNQYNFIGKWEAKIEHEGYLIEHGVKKKYLTSDANWIIEVFPNNTAKMKATIDTTGKSSLDWFYKEKEQKIIFIQKDKSSFEVDIIVNEIDYQKWTSKKEVGTKTEEWIYTLKRK